LALLLVLHVHFQHLGLPVFWNAQLTTLKLRLSVNKHVGTAGLPSESALQSAWHYCRYRAIIKFKPISGKRRFGIVYREVALVKVQFYFRLGWLGILCLIFCFFLFSFILVGVFFCLLLRRYFLSRLLVETWWNLFIPNTLV
jgi:hypothetical protein